MNDAQPTALAKSLLPLSRSLAWLRPYRQFGYALSGLLVLYAWPLYELLRLSLADDLYSHALLMPLASGYLIWLKRDDLPAATKPDRLIATVAGMGAALLLVGYLVSFSGTQPLPRDDTIALSVGSFVFAVIAAAAWFLGRPILKTLAFPFGSLVFMVPMPLSVMSAVESLLQHGSAVTAHWFFLLSGMPVFRDQTLFMLPGFSMEVAPECSGIRSSLALFITSTFAGYLFLRSTWKRVVLTLAVLPLALLRNGFRVWVIGELCVNVHPDMIHSFIHRQGGPIFFALSLVPFGLLLWALVRSERGRPGAVAGR